MSLDHQITPFAALGSGLIKGAAFLSSRHVDWGGVGASLRGRSPVSAAQDSSPDPTGVRGQNTDPTRPPWEPSDPAPQPERWQSTQPLGPGYGADPAPQNTPIDPDFWGPNRDPGFSLPQIGPRAPWRYSGFWGSKNPNRNPGAPWQNPGAPWQNPGFSLPRTEQGAPWRYL